MPLTDTADLSLLDPEEELRRRMASAPAIGSPGAERPAVNLPGVVPVSGEKPGPDIAGLNAPPKLPGVSIGSSAPPTIKPVSSTPELSPLQRDQSEESRLKTTGSGISQLQKSHPVIGGFARAADVLGSIIAPNVARQIPGTTLHHNALLGQQEGRVAQDLGEQEKQAQVAETTAKAHKAESDANTPTAELKPDEQAFAAAFKKTGDALEAYRQVKQAGEKPPNQQHIETDQGFFTLDPNGKPQPITFNGKPLMPKEAQKNTAEQVRVALDQAIKAGDQQKVTQLQNELKQLDPEGQQKINIQAGNQGTARGDRSYQFNAGQLSKVRQPIEQTTQRVGRLVDTLNQHSPQADALVAPELLSVMAGGAGSGLRMNEAEIARIIGGRSAWENLKASIQHWSTKPDDARSITQDQDKQIRSLVQLVHEKLLRKQAILDEADQALIEAEDPTHHRQIVTDARKKMDAVDGGEEQSGGSNKVLVEGKDF